MVGDGPFDLVFVGGWVLSAFETAWDRPVRDTLTALAQFSRLILFDKRGTGLSDRDAGLPDLETRMDDIRAVMDAVGSKRAAIIGVSEGGPITLLFAATYPERTAAAILYGTGASHTRADDYPWAMTDAEWDREIAGPESPAPGWRPRLAYRRGPLHRRAHPRRRDDRAAWIGPRLVGAVGRAGRSRQAVPV